MSYLYVMHDFKRNRYVLLSPGHTAGVQVSFPHEEMKNHQGEIIDHLTRPMNVIEYFAIATPGADCQLTDKGSKDVPDGLGVIIDAIFTQAGKLSAAALKDANYSGRELLERGFSLYCAAMIGSQLPKWIDYQSST